MKTLQLFVVIKQENNHKLVDYLPLYCSKYDGKIYQVKFTYDNILN